MADAASGGDEIKRIILRAEALNFSGTQKEVLSLNQALENLKKTLNSGAGLNKGQLSDINKELDILEGKATNSTSASKKGLDGMRASAERLNQTLKNTAQMTGANLTGNRTKDKQALKDYQQQLSTLGVGIVAKPKYVNQVVGNVQTIWGALKEGKNAGIATQRSLDSIATGLPSSMPTVTSLQRISVAAGVARKGLDGVTVAMKNSAKNAQWTGMQMMQGITFPLVGLGTVALRTFDSVNKEMIQLKKVTEYKEDYSALEKEIQKVAVAYGITLKASASLFTDIAALGKSGKDISEWADSVAQLSMVGDIDPTGAMEFFRVINAIFTDGSVQQTNDILAQLSAISDETSLQLKDLAAAFPEVAPVMQQMGFSAAGVASSLAGMYRRGIPATEAAHGLKFALQRLVVPTKDSKKIIDELGFSFTDANGNMMDGAIQVMRLAEQLKGMNDAQRLAAAPELFGGRQSARMNSYFADISLGNEEYRKLKDGILEVNQVQSDFLRGMIASGEIPMEGVASAADRYAKAVEEIKKDPSKALARIKTQMQVVAFEIGKSLAPAVISVGEKLVGLLQMFTAAPPIIQKMVLAFGALVVAIGPIRYIFAQMKYTFVSFVEVFNKFLPQLRDLPRGMAQVQDLLNIDPMRKDIAQIGDKFVLVQKGFINKIRMKFGLPPKAKGQILEYFDSFDKAAAGTAGTTTAANSRIAASNAVLQTSEDQVSDEFDETARSAARRIIATDAIIASNQRLTLSNLVAKAAESSRGGIPMPGVPIPRPMPAAPGAAPIADLATTAISQFGDETEKQISKIIKLKERLKLVDGVEYDLTSKKISQLQQMSGLTDDLLEKTLKQRSAQAASGLGKATKVMKELGPSSVGAAAGMAKLGSASGIAGASFGGIAATGGIILIVLAAVAAAIVAIVLAVKWFKSNWDVIWPKIKPAIENVKVAIEMLKKAFREVGAEFSKLGGIFSDIFGQLGTGADKSKSSAAGVGDVLAKIINGIARMIKIVAVMISYAAKLIQFLKPIIESVAYRIKNVVGFISALVNKDFKKAMMFLGAFFWEAVRPAAIAAQTLMKIWLQVASWMMSLFITIFNAVKWLVSNTLGRIPLIGKAFVSQFEQVGQGLSSVKGFFEKWSDDLNFVAWVDEKARTLGGLFSDTYEQSLESGSKKVDPKGKDVADTFKKQVEDSFKDWFPDWLGAIKSSLDEQIGNVKTAATKAFEESHKKAMLVFDQRTQAIEDTENAEKKLYATQAYLSKKREMIADREIRKQNYRNNRSLAIYEGRFNDVRMLDLEEIKDRDDFNSEVGNLESERAKDLLEEQRDALKKKIEAEKDAAEEIWEINEEAFNDQLDLLTKYTPKTIQEWDERMAKINDLLRKYGKQTLPNTIKSGQGAFVGAFESATDEIRDNFFWSGSDSSAYWMAGFAPLDVVAKLLSDVKSGVEDGGPDLTGDMGDLGDDAGGALKDSFEDALKDIKIEEIFDDLKRRIKIAVKIIAYTIILKIKEAWDTVKGWFKNPSSIPVFGGIFDNLGKVFGNIKQQISLAWEITKSWFKNPSSIPVFGGIFDSLRTSFSGTVDKIGQLWNTVKGWFSNGVSIPTFGGLFDSLRTTFWGTVVNVGQIWDSVKGWFSGRISVFGGLFDHLGGAFYGIVIKLGQLWDAVRGWFRVPVQVGMNVFKELLYRFLDAGNVIVSVIRSLPYIGGYLANIAENSLRGVRGWVDGMATGGLVQATSGGSLVNVGEGGYDEYVISTDPKYKASNIGYMVAAAAKLGISAKSSAAASASSRGYATYSAPSGSSGGGVSSQDVYISVDTFIGEEAWFAELSKKYNMKVTPRERKVAGQQKRVISSYNNRWDVK